MIARRSQEAPAGGEAGNIIAFRAGFNGQKSEAIENNHITREESKNNRHGFA
jgi:hypothetical protein